MRKLSTLFLGLLMALCLAGSTHAASVALSPALVAPSSTTTITLIGTGTNWATSHPTFTASAGTLSGIAWQSDTHATATYTAPSSQTATVTVTDPSDAQTTAISVLSPAGWTQVFTDNFSRANTSPGNGYAPVGNGWYDITSTMFTIQSNQLAVNGTSNLFGRNLLFQATVSTLRDERAVYTLAATTSAGTPGSWWGAMRMAPTQANGTDFDNYTWVLSNTVAGDTNTFGIFKVVSGAATGIVSGTVVGWDPTHVHTVDVQAVGANPTSLRMIVTDTTTGTIVGSTAIADSTAGLQTAGYVALEAVSTGPINFAAATIYQGSNLAVPDISVSSTNTAIKAVIPTPTGGTAPLTTTLQRSEDPSFPAPTSLGTVTPGTTYSDTAVLPGHQYFYRVSVTDASSTTVVSGPVYSDDAGATFGHPENVPFYGVVLTQPAGAMLKSNAALSVGLIGDSNTADLHATNPATTTTMTQEVANDLPVLLGYRDVTVDNEAIGGTNLQGWQKSGGTGIYAPAVSRFNAAQVSHIDINHGTNDGYPAATRDAYLRQLIRDLFADVPTLKSVSVSESIFPWYNGRVADMTAALPRMLGYRASDLLVPDNIKVFAGDRDAWTATANNAAWVNTSVGVHLSDTGTRRVGLMRSLGIARALYALGNPLSVTLTKLAPSTVLINWAADPLATAYKVARSIDGVNYTVIATVTAPTTTYTDAAEPAGNVRYRILPVH